MVSEEIMRKWGWCEMSQWLEEGKVSLRVRGKRTPRGRERPWGSGIRKKEDRGEQENNICQVLWVEQSDGGPGLGMQRTELLGSSKAGRESCILTHPGWQHDRTFQNKVGHIMPQKTEHLQELGLPRVTHQCIAHYLLKMKLQF